MGIVAEFARYGAKLKNQFWAVSALTDTELVASLWADFLITQPGGAWVYEDRLSRWSGNGNALFREHLATAIADCRPVRLVIARTDSPGLVAEGGDASSAKNTFKARPERIGGVESFDGDNFKIVFPAPQRRAGRGDLDGPL